MNKQGLNLHKQRRNRGEKILMYGPTIKIPKSLEIALRKFQKEEHRVRSIVRGASDSTLQISFIKMNVLR